MQPATFSVLSELSGLVSHICYALQRLLEDQFLELIQFAVSKGIPNGTEETKVVLEVVHHEQDTRQQLVGHQEVMDVGTSVPLTAVTAAPFQQRTKIIVVFFILQRYLKWCHFWVSFGDFLLVFFSTIPLQILGPILC